MANDEDFTPEKSMPSFKDEVVHKKKPQKEKKSRIKSQKKMTWNYRFWEKEKSKPQRGRKAQEQAKAEKVEQVKVERKPISISKPILMGLLTVLIMILGLLAPATIILAKAMDSLASSAENTLRRINNGNTKQNQS